MQDIDNIDKKSQVQVIVLTQGVLFPGNSLPLASLGDIKEDNILNIRKDNTRFVVISEIAEGKFSKIGTETLISGVMRLNTGNLGVVLKGIRRVHISQLKMEGTQHTAEITPCISKDAPTSVSFLAEIKALKDLVLKILNLNATISPEIVSWLLSTDDPWVLCDLIIPQLSINFEDKIKALETLDVQKLMQQTMRLASKEVELLKISKKIQRDVKNDFQEGFKKNYLKGQLIAIKKELGEHDHEIDEIEEIHEELKALALPKKVNEIAEKELDRLSMMTPGSPEYMVSWTYLSWIKDLPWKDEKLNIPSIATASKIINKSHYGLDKIKERILEYLAVIKHKQAIKGQVLLLSGPPGVGKTSLAKSIAEALKIPFARVSLGGVKDEADIRGHRRTYIGSMPGKILHAIKDTKSRRILILLDEIDKVGSFNGQSDLSSALLELLDYEQNNQFSDHYLGIPFDLSQVVFVATANDTRSIAAPLLDRMEVIELSGYTEQEKLHIASEHIIPFLRVELSLSHSQFHISETVLKLIIRHYTRESGVRQLQRALRAIGRKVVRAVVSTPKKILPITQDNLIAYLGIPHFLEEPKELKLPPGVAIGLAYTSVGGDILYIESRKTPVKEGRGRLLLTGSLGKVMQESAQTCLSFVHSYAQELGLDFEKLDKNDLHIHFPDGATPKDGPSAGVTMLATLVSLFTNKSIDAKMAFTGEVTLRGQVLPVGGIKEKFLAAHRYGKKTIVFPKANWMDLQEIPEEVLKDLKLYPVSEMLEVLQVTGLLPANGKKFSPQRFIKNKSLKNYNWKDMHSFVGS